MCICLWYTPAYTPVYYTVQRQASQFPVLSAFSTGRCVVMVYPTSYTQGGCSYYRAFLLAHPVCTEHPPYLRCMPTPVCTYPLCSTHPTMCTHPCVYLPH